MKKLNKIILIISIALVSVISTNWAVTGIVESNQESIYLENNLGSDIKEYEVIRSTKIYDYRGKITQKFYSYSTDDSVGKCIITFDSNGYTDKPIKFTKL